MNKIKTHFTNPLSYYEIAYFMKDYFDKNVVIVCIGTDRCIGDCLGPLVGNYLKESNFPLPIYGTVSTPIHALNINKKLKFIKNKHINANIIGIDACLGNEKNIGEIQARNYPIHPGKGVGKSLPIVGNASIIGIVDSNDCNELFTNRSIRLNLVMDMAKVISNAIIHTYYLWSNNMCDM